MLERAIESANTRYAEVMEQKKAVVTEICHNTPATSYRSKGERAGE